MPKGPGAGRAFAIATAQAQKMGYTDFTKGGRGAEIRGQIAERIAAKHPGGRGYGRKPRGSR